MRGPAKQQRRRRPGGSRAKRTEESTHFGPQSRTTHFGEEDKEAAEQDKERKERITSGRIELATVISLPIRVFASSPAPSLLRIPVATG
jgi:hypothetical protein